MIVEYSTFHDL